MNTDVAREKATPTPLNGNRRTSFRSKDLRATYKSRFRLVPFHSGTQSSLGSCRNVHARAVMLNKIANVSNQHAKFQI
jgi:hypothetical protein